MFSALGHGYNLFSFKHTPINTSLSSKIYENTSLYFIYLFVYLFISFGCLGSAFSPSLILQSVCAVHVCLCVRIHGIVHTFVCMKVCVGEYVCVRACALAWSSRQRHPRDPRIMD